jgi:antitoxin component of MazEF toxin-antitoxin module
LRKKLTKFGNSHGIVIDRPILDLLKINLDTELEITTDGEKLVISPVRKQEKKEEDLVAARVV